MVKRARDEHTLDMFLGAKLFPVETPRELGGALDFNGRISSAMARAIEEARERGLDRFDIARRMSDVLGTEVTKGMIDAYTSQARETHTISLVRFVAFARATGCMWLWNVVLADEGLTILQGEEALLAQAAFARKQAEHYAAEAKRLSGLAPLQVGRGARR